MPDPQRELILVHSSDLHLGNDVPGGSASNADELQPLRHVLQAASTARGDVLLLAGDIFDHNRVPPALLSRAARLMDDSGLRIVILPGNHDPLTPDSVYRRGGLADPPNVHVLGVTVDEAVHLPGLGLEIWGRAHLDYGDMSPLRDPPARSSRWQVATAHGHFVPGAVDPLRPHASWLIHEEELAATNADYVALGHWPRAARVDSGAVPAYYSGSPDLAGSVNVVRFRPDGSICVSRLGLGSSGART